MANGKVILQIIRAEASSQNENKICLYLDLEKNGIHSVQRDKVPEIRDFLLIFTGWGESSKVILQVSIAVFRALSKKIFGQRWLSPPRKNLSVRLCGLGREV